MGLLLLRAAVGLSLAVQGVAFLAGGDRGAWAAGPLAIATGVSLLIGFLTPVTSGLAALFSLGVALSLLPPAPSNVLGGAPATIYLVVMAAAVLLLARPPKTEKSPSRPPVRELKAAGAR